MIIMEICFIECVGLTRIPYDQNKMEPYHLSYIVLVVPGSISSSIIITPHHTSQWPNLQYEFLDLQVLMVFV